MIINKSEQFLTAEEIKDLQKAGIMQTLTQQLTTTEAQKEIQGIYDEISAKVDVINGEIMKRYSKSLNGDKAAILKDTAGGL